MYVTPDMLESLQFLFDEAYLACDTETTGLAVYGEDHLFSIIIATASDYWYFDFKDSGPLGEKGRAFLRELFSKSPRILFFHNAGFDMAMLEKFGITFHPDMVIHDTSSSARIVYNQVNSLALDYLGKRYLGEGKHDAVKAYVKENRCGYIDVPNDIMVPYGGQDTMLTYRLGMDQLRRIAEMDDKSPANWPKVSTPLSLQRKVTKTVYSMVKRGVRVDIDYCRDAIGFEQERIYAAMSEFEALTGKPFKKSSKLFANVFGEGHGRINERGNLSFDKNVIAAIDSPVARAINEFSDAKSRLNYFQGFIKFADESGFIHSNLNEMGAVTTRMSSSEPNLQNMKRPDEDDEETPEEYPVRRAIIPPSDDYCIVPIDYSQQEMRLLLDRAGAMQMIELVKGGMDIHSATSHLANVTRQEAKSVNFGIIYGMGVTSLAAKLKKDPSEAKMIMESVLDASPEIREFIKGVRRTARERGFVFSWNGQRFYLPEVPGQDMSYVMVNHLIQGGSAEITKYALCSVHNILDGMRSYLALTIHDEIIAMVHKTELFVVEKLKAAMEAAYPHRYLPMVAEVSHSWESLAYKIKGFPGRL